MDAAIDRSDPSGPRGRLLLDLSDLIFYLTHHPAVSGIQRVVAEVVPHISHARPSQYVAYSPARERFVQLDDEECEHLLGSLHAANDHDRTELQGRARRLQQSTAGAAPVVGEVGDVLAVLGAAWVYPRFFSAVHALKRDGAAVVVLLYDLIPVMFPGFPASTVNQFREYLPRVAALADRAPAISRATREDFVQYCGDHDWECPPGAVTRLAADQWREDRISALRVNPARAWPRPFVLLVSTIEARKNHVLALRGWRRLIERHGPEAVPDLVCVGRLGWNAFEFLEEFTETDGLSGRVHLLTDSVSDARLAALYRDCQFTVYPSRYEGWGLPVAESLDIGKPVVCARNSSLEEAGGDVATYFDDNDLDGFVGLVERYVMDAAALETDAARIRRDYHQPEWREIAEVILAEVDEAAGGRRLPRFDLRLGVEYGVGPLPPYEGGPGGEEYLDFLTSRRSLPMTGQIDSVERGLRSELALDHMGTSVDPAFSLTFHRPSAGDLYLAVATRPAAGEIRLQVESPLGVAFRRCMRGEAFIVQLGAGQTDEPVGVSISGTARRSDEPLIRSFVVVDDPADAARLVDRNLARLASALMAEDGRDHLPDSVAAKQLEMVTSSLSWRITKPLRGAKDMTRRSRRGSRRR